MQNGNSHDAPRERLRLDLEDVRSWLMEHIDGGEEVKGYDSVLSGYINTIDAALAALPSEKETTRTAFEAGVKWGREMYPASPAATPMKHFSEKVRNKKESEYGPFTNADWNAACALERESADLRGQLAEAQKQSEGWQRNFVAVGRQLDEANNRHAAELAAIKALSPSATAAMPKPPYDPDYLLEVAENTLIPVDEKKKAALFAVCDLFSKPDGYVKPPQVDHGGQSADSQGTSAVVEERTIEWLLGAMVDDEGRLILTRDYIVTCLRSRMKQEQS